MHTQVPRQCGFRLRVASMVIATIKDPVHKTGGLNRSADRLSSS
jgi:hypothetical protein